jgi:O-antigen ligase
MRQAGPVAAQRPLPESLSIALLGAAAVVAPLALGAAGNWLRFALEATMSLAVVLWAASARRPVLLAAMPLAVAATSLLQLVPLPDGILVRLAPVSAGAWKVALAGDTAAWGRISVDPAETAASIRRLLLGLATVAAVTDLARYQVQRKRLVYAIAASGLAILLAGLVFGPANKDRVMLGFVHLAGPIFPHHDPTLMPIESVGAGTTEWVTVAGLRYPVDTGNVGDGFGSYIYSNHYAGGVVLSLPVTIAAWLYATRGRLAEAARLLAAAALFGAAFWTVGPMASSRAGAAALVVAGLALACLVTGPGWPRRAAIVCLVAIAGIILAAFLLLLGPLTHVIPFIPDAYRKPLGDILNNARTLAAQVGFRMFLASPVLGTGLGSFSAVFPRYSSDACMLFFAHNEYAQLLAETGFAGAAVVMGLAIELGRRCIRFCRDAPIPYRILAAGPWAAVAGGAIHAGFDWNLHLPANALLACLVTGLAASSVPTRPAARQARVPAWLPQGLLIVAIFGSLSLLLRDAISETARQSLRNAVAADRLAIKDRRPEGDTVWLAAVIDRGISSARRDPANARLHLLIGQATLHLAGRTDDVTQREELLTEADKWMQQARRHCAICRGLAEPVLPQRRP